MAHTGHPLDGPRFKIGRAKSQIEDLEGIEQIIWRKHNHRLVKAEINPKTGNQVYRVQIDSFPSLEWGVAIGEIAYNLRSALDQLVWQLALLSPNAPADKTQFPIFQPKPKWMRPPKLKGSPLDAFGRHPFMESVKAEHQARIERLQPYKRGNGGRDSPLHLLNQINNADKHRLIQVVGIRMAGFVYSAWEGFTRVGHMGVSPMARSGILKNGAKFAEYPANVHVNPSFTAFVGFSKGCAAVRNKVVRSTLRSIAEHVSGIVESFAPEFP